ncbi:MAG: hypothetical protein M3Y82_14175 [Verrucomicrobiota bacterium]|nr:hypothetical protein [Verrucomicrobiota bacterium]
MNETDYRIRRATTEDVPSLIILWRTAHLPVHELEKRFTEFQLVESADGILGAIGLQISQQQGKIHSETFADFSQADRWRPLLWKRLNVVAQNHGLFRFWTQETAPFWPQNGFVTPAEKVLKTIPADFGEAKTWLYFQLKEENALPEAIEATFAKFKEAEKAKTEKIQAQARLMKVIATLIAVLLFVGWVVCLFYMFKTKQRIIR